MLDWDPGVSYKRIVVLDGGYKEWLTCYPTKTTNSGVVVPDVQGNNIGATLEGVEYPDLIHSDEEQAIFKAKPSPVPPERSLKPVVKVKKIFTTRKSSIQDDQNADDRKNNMVSRPKARTNITDGSLDDGTTNPRIGNPNPRRNNTVRSSFVEPAEDELPKPVVDRSSKPSSVKTYDPDSKKILSLLKRKGDVVKSKVKLEDEQLMLERELFNHKDEADNLERNAKTMKQIELLNACITEKVSRY